MSSSAGESVEPSSTTTTSVRSSVSLSTASSCVRSFARAIQSLKTGIKITSSAGSTDATGWSLTWVWSSVWPCSVRDVCGCSTPTGCPGISQAQGQHGCGASL